MRSSAVVIVVGVGVFFVLEKERREEEKKKKKKKLTNQLLEPVHLQVKDGDRTGHILLNIHVLAKLLQPCRISICFPVGIFLELFSRIKKNKGKRERSRNLSK